MGAFLSMPFRVQCPHCQKEFKINESLAGRKARCNGCKNIIRIPSAPATKQTIAADNRPESETPQNSGSMGRSSTPNSDDEFRLAPIETDKKPVSPAADNIEPSPTSSKSPNESLGLAPLAEDIKQNAPAPGSSQTSPSPQQPPASTSGSAPQNIYGNADIDALLGGSNALNSSSLDPGGFNWNQADLTDFPSESGGGNLNSIAGAPVSHAGPLARPARDKKRRKKNPGSGLNISFTADPYKAGAKKLYAMVAGFVSIAFFILVIIARLIRIGMAVDRAIDNNSAPSGPPTMPKYAPPAVPHPLIHIEISQPYIPETLARLLEKPNIPRF